jgi:hypothetical protein
MSSSIPVVSILVARFLRSNNYSETLDTFIREAGLPPDAGSIGVKHDDAPPRIGSDVDDIAAAEHWTLESIIQEKKKYDQSLRFERYGDDGVGMKDGWRIPGKDYFFAHRI